jgi:hypothetical protein
MLLASIAAAKSVSIAPQQLFAQNNASRRAIAVFDFKRQAD